MILKSISKDYIKFNISAFTPDGTNIIKEIIKEYFKDNADAIEEIEDYDNINGLFSILGFTITSSKYDSDNEGSIICHLITDTNYIDIIQEFLKKLYQKSIILEYIFKCWQSPLDTNYYTLTNKSDTWKKVPLLLFESKVSKDREYIYFIDNKFILSDKRNKYEGREWTPKDIISELDSPWTPMSFSYLIQFSDSISTFMCEYEAYTYDAVSISAYGYGSTEEEALKNCKDRIAWIRDLAKEKESYNPYIDTY